MERRKFMGFAVATAPLVALVGVTGERSFAQFKALPLPDPGPGLVEWLNLVGEPSRLGRYGRPLTEAVLLEAVSTCGIPDARTVTLSCHGIEEYLALMGGERRYSIETRDDKTMGYAEDILLMMSPGKVHSIEVHFRLPNGFLTVA